VCGAGVARSENPHTCKGINTGVLCALGPKDWINMRRNRECERVSFLSPVFSVAMKAAVKKRKNKEGIKFVSAIGSTRHVHRPKLIELMHIQIPKLTFIFLCRYDINIKNAIFFAHNMKGV